PAHAHRGGPRAAAGRRAPAERARRERDHAVRRQGAGAPGQARPVRLAPGGAGRGARGRRAMSADAALMKLGESTAEAAAGLLEMFAPGKVKVTGVSVVPGDANPLDALPAPCVATSVSYTE